MIRQIIHIDEEKCNGCGLCANACHEGAIDIVNGKAKLVRENFCDGFGDCLPNCPAGAITFEQREAPEYDEDAVARAKALKLREKMKKRGSSQPTQAAGGGCPGSASRVLQPQAPAGHNCPGSASRVLKAQPSEGPVRPQFPGQAAFGKITSRLRNWPPQIRLAPITASYYDGADLLIAADCTAYSYGDFHRTFMEGRTTLIGCPKLDPVDYSEKLTEIFAENDIHSVTVTRMQVPCCGGLERAVKKAIAGCGKDIPLQVITIGMDGEIL